MPKSLAFIGGIIGLVIFIVVGLLPSLVYGGYAGILLAQAIFTGPIHLSILSQITVVFATLLGVLSVGGLFILIGAISIAGIGNLLSINNRTQLEERRDL